VIRGTTLWSSAKGLTPLQEQQQEVEDLDDSFEDIVDDCPDDLGFGWLCIAFADSFRAIGTLSGVRMFRRQ